jgi:hypothetical protein
MLAHHHQEESAPWWQILTIGSLQIENTREKQYKNVIGTRHVIGLAMNIMVGTLVALYIHALRTLCADRR